ncbi:uncharacterized protein LOC141538287 [Cotesia typhae]|uniref:uncharacterized protein LOC141538287 n=1 Tax=Cotesia typhae TaxID=2053667 RepID=UPI003D6983F8
MELIDNGFTNNSNPVIKTSNLVNDQIVSRRIDIGNPQIVVNGDLKPERIEGCHPSYPTYVIKFEPIPNLVSLIFEFMRSTIWNLKSPIFILDISERPHDRIANTILQIFRKFDMLVSYYLHYDNNKDSIIVYTLNPYTQFAPLPWHQVRLANRSSKTKPTLYSLEYPKDVKKNYQIINFDKTQYLDGHRIKLLELSGSPNLTEQRKQKMIYEKLKQIKDTKDLFLYSLSDYMKVNATLFVVESYFSDKLMKRRQFIEKLRGQTQINFSLDRIVSSTSCE